jgi:DNA polymerase III delta subunit
MALEQSLYVLVGSEPVRRRYLLDRLRSQAGSWETHSASDIGPEELLMGSLLLDPQAPLVRMLTDYAKWSPAQRKAFAAEIQTLEPGSGLCVVMTIDRLGAKDVLHGAIPDGSLIQIEQPARGRYADWVGRQAQLSGVGLPAGWPDRLVEMIGENTEALAAEIDKASLLAQDGKVSAADMQQIVSPVAQSAVWIWADALMEGNKPKALQALGACEGAEDAPLALLGALWNKVLGIAWAHQLSQEQSGMKDYPWRKTKELIGAGWDKNRTSKAIQSLAEIEAGLKGASGLDGYTQLARLSAQGL